MFYVGMILLWKTEKQNPATEYPPPSSASDTQDT